MPRLAVIKSLLLLILGTLSLIGFPRQLDLKEFRSITRPLDISVDRASPALSALEDCRLSFNDSEIMEYPMVVQTEIKEATPLNINLNPARHIELKPMVISAKTRSIDPMAHKNRKIEIARAYWDNTEPSLTLSEKAQSLVHAEKQNNDDPLYKEIASTTGNKIVVAATEKVEAPEFNVGFKVENAFETPKRVVTLPKNKPRPHVFRPLPDNVDDIYIPMTGEVRFEGGSAFARGYDELSISHIYGHQIIEVGTWNEKDNRYRIDLKIPRGEILGQVHSREGVLLAEGRMDLSAMQIGARQKRLDGKNLAILPIQEGLKLRVMAASSKGLFVRKNLNEPKVELAGIGPVDYSKQQAAYFDPDIVRPSLAILRASFKNFWPSIKIGKASYNNVLNIFESVHVETLQKLVMNDDKRANRKKESVIWGKLSKDGKPMSGAVVDLPFREDEKIVYYSGPIPDRSRVISSDTGEYSILLKGEQGVEVLRVQQIGQSILPIYLATAPGHVSDTDIQVLPARQFEFQTYEAFSGYSLPTALNIVGEESVLESNEVGFTSVRRRPVLGESLIEADAGEKYAMTRVSFNERTSFSRLPIFTETWLSQIRNGKDSGHNKPLIGEVTGSDFTVEILGLPAGYKPEITYYNVDGSPREESFGVSEGKYVVHGLPAGLVSYRIQPLGSGYYVTDLAVVDDRAVFFKSTNLLN